ncbi:MAG: amidohydrolase family protein [Phycisphaerae bacterium]|nr:amidohydrolase family protein [Phycisphaerae bacterium]
MSKEVRLFRGIGAADARGEVASPGAVLVSVDPRADWPELIASGPAEAVSRHEAAADARVVNLDGAVLLPGLVNAHTHLDLTHIGPRPFDPSAGFGGWARMIVNQRLRDSEALRESVRSGINLSIAGGVVAVGDISGVMQLEPIRTLQDSGMAGVSFVEYFGVGARQEEIANRVATFIDRLGPPRGRIRVGLQPHAPYTAGLRLYDWTARQHLARHLPVCTHLAETASEREFVARGTGPFRAFLESMGFWDDSVLSEVGRDRTPLEHLGPILRAAPWLVAHVNDCDDAGMRVLAESGTSVAYCPRSSWYFRNHEAFGPHRYRDMLRSGINVCLGTDSIVNLPPSESATLSTLDEMRYLFRRDGTDASLLMAMATTNGARALGLDPALFSLRAQGGPHARPLAGLIAVNVTRGGHDGTLLDRVMRSSGPPRVLLTPRGWEE